MSKKTLKPDTIIKNYWRNNEQFADLFNAVLFQGEQIIKPEELEDADTENMQKAYKLYIMQCQCALWDMIMPLIAGCKAGERKKPVK